MISVHGDSNSNKGNVSVESNASVFHELVYFQQRDRLNMHKVLSYIGDKISIDGA